MIKVFIESQNDFNIEDIGFINIINSTEGELNNATRSDVARVLRILKNIGFNSIDGSNTTIGLKDAAVWKLSNSFGREVIVYIIDEDNYMKVLVDKHI